jgi:hypothetical protein
MVSKVTHLEDELRDPFSPKVLFSCIFVKRKQAGHMWAGTVLIAD